MRAYFLRRSALCVAVLGLVCSSASRARAQSAPQPAVPAPAPAAPAPAPPLAAPPPAPPGATAPPPAYPGYPPPGAYPPGNYPAYPAYPGAYAPPPPGYTYAYPVPRRPPESVPYDGGPVPAGYHIEERPRRGAVIAGAVILGSSYALGLTVGSTENFPNATGWLVVPVLGPWITLASRHRTDFNCGDGICDGTSDEDSTTRTFLILDGLTQATGTILLAYGLASTKKVVTRDFIGNLHFVPSQVGRTGLGGFVFGQF